MRLKGDTTVNACLDSQLERENTLKGKSSTAVKSNSIVVPIVESTTTSTPPCTLTQKQTINKAKKLVKKSITEDIIDKWNGKVRKLVMQGDFASLLIEKKTMCHMAEYCQKSTP